MTSIEVPQDLMKNHDAPPARVIADYIAGMTDRYALQIAKDMHELLLFLSNKIP